MGVVFSDIAISFNYSKMEDTLARCCCCKEILNNGFLEWKSEDPSENWRPTFLDLGSQGITGVHHSLVNWFWDFLDFFRVTFTIFTYEVDNSLKSSSIFKILTTWSTVSGIYLSFTLRILAKSRRFRRILYRAIDKFWINEH